MSDESAAQPDVRLQRLRAELDAIDARIVEALADRLRVIGVISAFKETQSEQLRDRRREEAVLQQLRGYARDLRLDPLFVERLFREILDYSVRRQEEHLLARARGGDVTTIVAYQGAEGSWGHIAAERHFSVRGGDIEYRSFDEFPEMLQAVRSGTVQFALLPIENTTAGSINETYDLLAEMDVSIVGEEVQRVDHRENYTRFVVVGPRLLPCDPRIACKTSLIFTTKHKQGALVSCLNVLAAHGLSLTKLESRPRRGSPWEYVFYVDFEGNLQDDATEAALREVSAHVLSLKVLGCYPARMPKPGPEPS